MRFRGEEGEHFFRATLIQTLFYGIFSSWVIWARDNGARQDTTFNWHETAWNLHVPLIAALFSQIATPSKLKPLGIDEILDWTGNVLNRVDREKFFDKFEEEHAVQYFYEPFLRSYDPGLRKDLGVWYTPPEIVRYQVKRVDDILREELGISEGFADSNVYVLDPCCGTGAYLIEVLKRIHETLSKFSKDALIAQRLKKTALERLFGFEILPAPFVVSHLQLGLTLKSLGAPLSHKMNERANVFLTNALTGWEPPKNPKDQLSFPELKDEREAAEKVKQETPILVILGNPPYNAFAGTSPDEEGELIEPYKDGLRSYWKILSGSMHDLYIRFFRIAQRRIVNTGKGVICYISNFSYLSDSVFVAMRKNLLKDFDAIWLDCMNGDSRETGKLTPEGKPDPSVFSTEYNREGIRVGTAIGLFVRKGNCLQDSIVRFRHFWGVNKRADLIESLNSKEFNKCYEIADPSESNRFSFRPQKIDTDYLQWPKLAEICKVNPFNGLFEKRGGALIDSDKESLERRIRAYFDKTIRWQDYSSLGYGLERKRAEIEPEKVRTRVLATEDYETKNIIRYAIRAFETQWAYYCGIPGVWNRPRPNYKEQCWEGNTFLLSRPAGVTRPEGVPFFFSTITGDNDFLRGHAYYFPVMLRKKGKTISTNSPTIKLALADDNRQITEANLSAKSKEYLEDYGFREINDCVESARLIWNHALAIGYSPTYLSENSDGIRDDWPRIPLPNSKDLLMTSSELGKQVAALLNTEEELSRVTFINVMSDLKSIAVVSSIGGAILSPDAGHFDLIAGWGYSGKDGITMPGKGKIHKRPYAENEIKEIERGSKTLGLSTEQVLQQFGENTCDIYLNDRAYWKNVPTSVWSFYIGGYQVIKKWLSYREKSLLGRPMKLEEIEYVTAMTRRIAAILLLQPRLNENYLAVKSNIYSWPDS